MPRPKIAACLLLAAGALAPAITRGAELPPLTLLNVSYDPTRELYEDVNAAFARHWKARTGQDVVTSATCCSRGRTRRSSP